MLHFICNLRQNWDNPYGCITVTSLGSFFYEWKAPPGLRNTFNSSRHRLRSSFWRHLYHIVKFPRRDIFSVANTTFVLCNKLFHERKTVCQHAGSSQLYQAWENTDTKLPWGWMLMMWNQNNLSFPLDDLFSVSFIKTSPSRQYRGPSFFRAVSLI